MSGLGQFDAGYNAAQDRILLRITTTDGDEYRLWLTRRFCASLLGEFKVNVSAYRIQSPTPESASATASAAGDLGAATVMQADMQQELVAAQQNFKQEFKPGERFPLGEQGEVIERVDLQPDGKGPGNHALSLQSVSGQVLTIAVTPEFLNSIFEIIERVSQQAEWGLVTTASSMANAATLQ